MQTKHPTQRKFITLAEAAKYCSVHERSIRRLVAAKQLTAYRVLPGAIRIDFDELCAYVDGTADRATTRGRHLQSLT
jgi:excisionase family DNA binding protein